MIPFLRKEIQTLKGYHLDFYSDVVKLNQNEIPYDIPGEIKAKVLEKLVLIPWNRYPQPQPVNLRQKLSQELNWPVEGILISNGSNVLIQAAMMATALHSKILTIDPTFSLYEIEGLVFGNQIQKIPLGENFSFPLNKILETIASDPPNLIIFPNPNAPTGNLFPKEALIELVRKAPCLVMIDEAYCQFAEENLLDELKNFKNLVLLRTFSKAFGVGGVRMGFAIGHPEVMNQISKVMLPYCVSAINELVAEAILDHPELTQKRVAEVKVSRAWLYQTLSGIEGVKTFPSQTNFIIFQVADSKAVFQKLLDAKVLVRDVSHPDSLPNTLRVTVGSQEENEKFVAALQKSLR